jgi:hypothetical protein
MLLALLLPLLLLLLLLSLMLLHARPSQPRCDPVRSALLSVDPIAAGCMTMIQGFEAPPCAGTWT